MNQYPRARRFGWEAVAGVGIATLMGGAALLAPHFSDDTGPVTETTVPVQELGVIEEAIVCGVGTARDEDGNRVAYVNLDDGSVVELSDPNHEQMSIDDIHEAARDGNDLDGSNELLLELIRNQSSTFTLHLIDGQITSATQLTGPAPNTDAICN